MPVSVAVASRSAIQECMSREDEHDYAELDADIRLLGDALNEAVGQLSGDHMSQLVLRLRDDANSLRAGSLDGGRDAFAATIGELSTGDLDIIARVFTQWFHLVNSAEEQHRIRVLRRRDEGDGSVVESLVSACERLSERGVSADELRGMLGKLFIMPVLTAHPTEARRRTIIDHLGDIASGLDRLDAGMRSRRDRERITGQLKSTVLALYGSEPSHEQKPTPIDEVRTGLEVFQRTLLDVTPQIYRALEDALSAAYPGESFDVPLFLRWGTWIGGDRDGNPFVTSAVTRSAMERQRQLILGRYSDDVEHMLRLLSVSSRRTVNSDGLTVLNESLDRDREELPDTTGRAQRYTVNEPWREKLWYMRARLAATLARGDAAYVSAQAFVDDLRLLEASLTDCGFSRLANGVVRDCRRRAEVFGFHLATMDIRQHSAVHEAAVDELLRHGGVDNYLELDEEARQQLLSNLLDHASIGIDVPRSSLSAATRELLTTLDMVGRARREQGSSACERYVVSFTSQPSDLLEVLFLLRAAGMSPGELRPVPLLEQLEDLDRADQIAHAMLDLAPIRAALGGELEIMIGYSDAGKQIGYLASNVALRRAQQKLAKVAKQRGVLLTIFHGRGGTIGRGGGPANRAIRAQPADALDGRLRVTEQGETITARYARNEIAQRDLEQMVHAVLIALAERDPAPTQEWGARDEMLDRAGVQAQASYTQLLSDEQRLAKYALSATPIRQVAELRIGSRPSSRKPGMSFDDLRAIPWVFSWNQSRHGLPGWYGLGTALEVIMYEHGLDRARELYRSWQFFRALINNAQLALTRADIDVAECYSRLADDDAREIFELIRKEHQLTVSHVLAVVDRQQLLGNRPHLVRAVKRRNPYVDILSHAQIELLRRLADAGEGQTDEIRAALAITINGIAAGLQTAG